MVTTSQTSTLRKAKPSQQAHRQPRAQQAPQQTRTAADAVAAAVDQVLVRAQARVAVVAIADPANLK
jgi:hypothetical protein